MSSVLIQAWQDASFHLRPTQRNGLDQEHRTNMSSTFSNVIENQLQLAIQKHPHLQEKSLRFDTCEGRVTMHGSVKTWYEKQMAQEALRNIDGVIQIDNQLTVEAI